jgi:hypothetical protein
LYSLKDGANYFNTPSSQNIRSIRSANLPAISDATRAFSTPAEIGFCSWFSKIVRNAHKEFLSSGDSRASGFAVESSLKDFAIRRFRAEEIIVYIPAVSLTTCCRCLLTI